MFKLEFKNADTHEGGRVAYHIMSPQNNEEIHEHDFTELVLITGGSGTHFNEHSSYNISTRDLFVIPLGQKHGYKNTRNLSLINIMFKEDFISLSKSDIVNLPGYQSLFIIEPGMKSGEGQSHLKLGKDKWLDIQKSVDLLRHEIDSEEGGHALYVDTLLTQIIIQASRAYPGVGHFIDDESFRLAELFSFIEQNLHHPLNTPELADIAGISLSTLQRKIRSVTGESLTSMINRLRIERSKTLLHDTDLSVTQVALRVGFEDGNYFSKVFRKFLGTSPRQWRLKE